MLFSRLLHALPSWYDFALHPEDAPPSGTANFSCLESSALELLFYKVVEAADQKREDVPDEAIPSLFDGTWDVVDKSFLDTRS
jgi:hypothetical protein